MFFFFEYTGFNVEMSVRLDKEYTAELNDPTSFEYKDLESSINSVVSTLLTHC